MFSIGLGWRVAPPSPKPRGACRLSLRTHAEPKRRVDYYQVLELESRTATDAQIKAAYRRLARKWHPDVNPSAEAAAVFKSLTRAFEILGDQERRREYDRSMGVTGASGAKAPPPPPAGSTRQSQQQRRGADLRTTLSLSLAEAIVGGRHKLDVRALASCGVCRGSGGAPGGRAERCQVCKGRGDIMKTRAVADGATSTAVIDCPACGGRGLLILDACSGCDGSGLQRRPLGIEIAVPAGTEDGTVLRVAGRGDAGECGGPRGDLLVRVAVQAATGVERKGMDLYYSEVAVPLLVAILGGTVTVTTLTEGPRPLKVPPGTPHGAQLTLERGGVLGRGSDHFRVRIKVPREVSPAEEAVLRRLAEVVR